MQIEVLVAHAKDENIDAEKIIDAIKKAGFKVWSRETVLAGDSFTEEASKALDRQGPVVLCGTLRAVGSKWSRKLVNAAEERGKRTFIVQMEEEAAVDSLSFGKKIASYWKDPTKALENLIDALKNEYSSECEKETTSSLDSKLNKYQTSALKSYDIIDLANLPDSDRNILNKRLELRQLYVPIRLKTESVYKLPSSKILEKNEIGNHQKDTNPNQQEAITKEEEIITKAQETISIGENLEQGKLVILGDPGSGKTTLLKWLATAYLLKNSNNPEFSSFPDINTLPNKDLTPFIIRCRTINQLKELNSFEEILNLALHQLEMFSSEVIPQLVKLFLNKLELGEFLLLIDGLDEIKDITKRIKFCEQIEKIKESFPENPVVVTSRVVGYKELGQRLRDFEHFQVAPLSRNDKIKFVKQWCKLTESPQRRRTATRELIEDIHSTDRIEKITQNPMLLTTLALVKRNVGRLPSRRVDLYWDALKVLLNWRRVVDAPIEWREATPQLGYVAFEMCRKGVQQLREDEILELFKQIRREYPNNHDIKNATPRDFLSKLERRTGILLQKGTERYLGIPYPVYEFRHLTFQEYLAARALVDGFYPNRKDEKIYEKIAPLAGQTSQTRLSEASVGEYWQETLRLCISVCADDDVDDILRAILEPNENEDMKITSRSRACLSASCLVEEPNASPQVAEEIISRLVEFIRSSDKTPEDIISSRVDTVIRELASTRWAEILKSKLYSKLKKRNVNDRVYIAELLGFAGTQSLPSNNYEYIRWLHDQIINFDVVDEEKTIETALILWHYSRDKDLDRIEIIPNLIEKLFEMVEKGGLSSYVASATLRALNSTELGNFSWRPTQVELEKILFFITKTNLDENCIRDLIFILGREKYFPASETILDKLNGKDKKLKRACLFAIGELGKLEYSKYIKPYLDNIEPEVELDAIEAFGKIKDVSNLHLLKEKLKGADESMCKRILITLSKVDSKSSAEIFQHYANDDRAEISSLALEKLADIEKRKYKHLFIEKSSDKDCLVRKTAIKCLSGFDGDSVVKILNKSLSDPEESVREAAITNLYIIDNVEKEDILKSILENDPSVAVKLVAGLALSKSRSPEIIEFLKQCIHKSENILSYIASISLREIIDSDEIQVNLGNLIDELKEDYEGNWDILVKLLGENDEDVLNQAEQFLNHEKTNFRISAIETLKKSKNDNLNKLLVSKFVDEENRVRAAAINALRERKASNITKDLINCLEDSSSKVRSSAALALANVSEAEDSLIMLLDDTDNFVRRCAIATLAKINSEKSVDTLIDRLSQESRNIRKDIINFLGSMRDLKSYDALQNLLTDEDTELREKAADAFSSLAYKVFDSGDIEKCLSMFEESLKVTAADEITRNNAAFCALILGKYDIAEKHLNCLSFSKEDSNFALYKNNMALQVYLNNDKKEAIKLIQEGLDWIPQAKEKDYDTDVHAVLVLKDGVPTGVTDIPIDAALLFNLFSFQGITKKELIENLSNNYRSELNSWIDFLNLKSLTQ